ncbi:Opine oxidase subunit B [Fusarium oxysporum f. sp. albedinis]|nr:Opine oxidase subunit B [Fusarium oxysporum f. sp. albedinis]
MSCANPLDSLTAARFCCHSFEDIPDEGGNVSLMNITRNVMPMPAGSGGTLITNFPCFSNWANKPTLHLLSQPTTLRKTRQSIAETGHSSIGCRAWSGTPTTHLDWLPRSHRVRRTAPPIGLLTLDRTG